MYAKAIVTTPKVQCFVTETTQHQLLRQGVTQKQLKESPLKLVNSRIDEARKESTVSMISSSIKRPNIQRSPLRQALYEITEASGVCYKPMVAPLDDFTPPLFVTANSHFYRQLLTNPAIVEKLHDVMNLSGFDFLIRFLRLKDCFALLKCAHPKGNCIAEEIDFRRNPDNSNILYHVDPHDRHNMEISINAYQCALYASEWGDIAEADRQMDKALRYSFVDGTTPLIMGHRITMRKFSERIKTAIEQADGIEDYTPRPRRPGSLR